MSPAGEADRFSLGVSESAALRLITRDDGPATLRRRLAAVEGLSEAETLERLVERCLPPSGDTATPAQALLARFGGVGRVLGAPHAELAQCVGEDLAEELSVLHGLMVRVLQHPLRQREVLSSWEAATAYLRARLGGLPREAFHVLFLDTKNQLIADERMAEGSVNHAPVYPREVVRRALELSANAVLLAHNHPSGDPTPSRGDIEMTKRVVEAARALDIQVYDHLIVGADAVVSLRRQGLM